MKSSMPMMPKKKALESLIKAMKELRLKKVKGFKDEDDDIPTMIAEMKKKKEDEDED